MSRSTTLMLLVIVVGAVAAVGYLMMDGPLAGVTAGLDRDGAGEDGEVYIDPETGEVVLRGAEGAKRPPTEEELEAMRKAAAKPKFKRSEGVFGQVLNGKGEPVPRAVVKLMAMPEAQNRWAQQYRPDPAPIATTVTDETGAFLVGPAPEEGGLRLRAEAGGYAPTIQWVRCRGYKVDLVLDRGGGLEVTVKDGKGQLVSGALVFHRAGTVSTQGRTAENGVVSFSALPTGTGSLLVTSEGNATLQQDGVAVAPGKVEKRTVVLPEPVVLEGRTLADVGQQPVPGTQVIVKYPSHPWLDDSAPVTSDETGRFEVELLAPLGQNVTLYAKAEDRPDVQVYAQVQDSGGGRMNKDITLPTERGSFTGRVVDLDDHAVPGATVMYANQPGDQAKIEATTGPDGAFELKGAPWASGTKASAQLLATAPGYGVGSVWARMQQPNGAPQEAKIKLSGMGRLEGRVTNGAGEPVSGALVSLQVDYAEIQQLQRGGRRIDYRTLNAIQNRSLARLEAVTEDDGSYVMDQVPASSYRASVHYGLLSAMDEDSLTVSSEQTARRDLTLGEPITLEGYVNDADGIPIPGAYVYAYPQQQRGPGWGGYAGRKSCRSQADGRFVIHGVQDIEYTVQASATGYGSKREKNVRGGVTDLDLVLVPRGWIDGVLELDGQGYAGTFSVRATRVRNGNNQGNQPAYWSGGNSYGGYGGGGTFSPDDGTFKLQGLSAGEYDLSATTPEGWITAGSVRVGVVDGRATETRLLLTRGAIVTGVLLEDLTGKPVARARVYASPKPGGGQAGPQPSKSANTDAKGRFALKGLGSGAYVLRVYPPSGSNFEKPIDLMAGEEREIQLREEAPGSIRILALDTEGAVLKGVTPQIATESGRTVWVNWQRMQKEEGFDWGRVNWTTLTQTNAEGINFRKYLTPGRYKITAYGQGYRSTEPLWVEVQAGRTVEATIILKKN